MKRILPYLACLIGIAVLVLLMPRFNDAQPRGIRLTRSDAVPIADAEARRLGIPVDRSWTVLSWANSTLLDKELEPKPELRRRANDDPVIGPRLGGYKRVYYRRGLEKSTPYGYVVVDQKSGSVLMARVQARTEETGAHLTEAQLRPRADAFVHSRNFPGAPSPQFEDARPNVMRSRTDWLVPLSRAVDVPHRQRRSVSLRLLHRRSVRGLGAHRGVRRRQHVPRRRRRQRHRLAVRALRHDVRCFC